MKESDDLFDHIDPTTQQIVKKYLPEIRVRADLVEATGSLVHVDQVHYYDDEVDQELELLKKESIS